MKRKESWLDMIIKYFITGMTTFIIILISVLIADNFRVVFNMFLFLMGVLFLGCCIFNLIVYVKSKFSPKNG